MTQPRHVCPECQRTIAVDGSTFWSIPDLKAFVYLHRHNRPEGGRCPGKTAPVVRRAPG